jgi:hypothetical protein
MKHCKTCNTTKPLSDFGLLRGKPRHICKECRKIESKQWYENNKDRKKELSKQYKHIKKDKDLQTAYGIDLETYNAMLATQGNCCKICGKHREQLKRALCVDHCHTTGTVRGLLCDTCNRSLGLLKDSVKILERAVKYLEGKL